MLDPRNLYKLFAGALISAAAITACGLDGTGKTNGGYATETEACVECQTILVECTSTSREQTQFVQCRDQWQSCQASRGLSPEMCSNPSDTRACDLCRKRTAECKAAPDADLTKCEEEFGICKAYLITRGDIQQNCTEQADSNPEVACGVCKKDLAVCLSDTTLTNPDQICSQKFDQCIGANTIVDGHCERPMPQEGCELCTAHHADCAASGGPSCEDGFNSCSASLASGFDCALDTAGTGSGGAGGMGAGGMGGAGGAGGGSTNTCSHDVCENGAALEAGCDGGTCVDNVCALDAWCCENEWDEFCVDKAVAEPSCSCSA